MEVIADTKGRGLEERLRDALPTLNSEAREGLQKFFHGNLYQIKLSLFFGIYLWQKSLNKGSFCLATEVVYGEKFDDLVIITKSDDGTNKISIMFLQAKHIIDEKKNKITMKDLKKDNSTQNPFGLIKYFTSYQAIKRNPLFNGYYIENCYLCTNCEVNKSVEKITTVIKDGHPFFLQECGELRKVTAEPGTEIYEKLKSANDFTVLYETLATHAKDNKQLQSWNPIYSIYHVALIKEKIIQPFGEFYKFCDEFLDDKLEGNASVFRAAFLKKYTDDQSNSSEYEVLNKLKETRFTTSSFFGKIFRRRAVEDLEIGNFISKLFDLIVNADNITKIKYDRRQVGKKGITGFYEIEQLAGHVFVYAENNNRVKFRKSFFDDSFGIDDGFSYYGLENKEETAKNVLNFKKALQRKFQEIFLSIKNGCKTFEDLEKCRFIITKYNGCPEDHPSLTLPINEEVDEKEINEFFDIFLFAVNQPNEERLTELIHKDLSEIFNMLDATVIVQYMIEKAMEWAKDKKGGYLDGIQIDYFFQEAKEIRATQMQVVPTQSYCRKLKYFGNNHIIEELKHFLSTSDKILWLLNDKPVLIATNVEATLKETHEQFKKDDGFVFNTLSGIIHSMEVSLLAFNRTTVNKNVLIIVAEYNAHEEEMAELSSKLLKIIEESENKKLVIISKENSIFANSFKTHVRKTHITFKDLIKSRSNKVITFQGKIITAKDLFKDDDDDADIHDNLGFLMSDKRICIGKPIKHKKREAKASQEKSYGNEKVFVVPVKEKTDLKILMNNKMAERKDLFSAMWVAQYSVKTILQKHKQKPNLSYKEILLSSIKNSNVKKVFNHLFDMNKVILVLNGFDRKTPKDGQVILEIVKAMKIFSHELWIFTNEKFGRQLNHSLSRAIS